MCRVRVEHCVVTQVFLIVSSIAKNPEYIQMIDPYRVIGIGPDSILSTDIQILYILIQILILKLKYYQESVTIIFNDTHTDTICIMYQSEL